MRDRDGSRVAGAILTITDHGRRVEVTAPEGGKTETIHQTRAIDDELRPGAAVRRPVLAAEGLVKSYGGRAVVQGVSLRDRRPEKSSACSARTAPARRRPSRWWSAWCAPTAGVVRLGERDLTDLPMYRRARAGISYLPQEPSVFRKMTVEQNLLAILETLDLTPAERRQRADELLAEFGLEAVRAHRAYTLSGGERRRVEIARSLVVSPSFLLLDEPFAGIDPIAVLDIQAIARRLASSGIGVLVTDHNVRETLTIVDRAYIIHDGQILRAGTPLALSSDAVVKKIYLGEAFQLK